MARSALLDHRGDGWWARVREHERPAGFSGRGVGVWCRGEVIRFVRFADLAATDFPVPWGTVSWALGVFTAEFGMGSGVGAPAMATRSAKRPAFGREEGSSCIGPGFRSAAWASPFGRFAAARGVIALGPFGPFARMMDQACRAISTGQLRASPPFHTRPIDVLVLHGSRGVSVSRRVSRLDAFSGYPVRT